MIVGYSGGEFIAMHRVDWRWVPVQEHEELYRGFLLIVQENAVGAKRGKVLHHFRDVGRYVMDMRRALIGTSADPIEVIFARMRDFVDRFYLGHRAHKSTTSCSETRSA